MASSFRYKDNNIVRCSPDPAVEVVGEPAQILTPHLGLHFRNPIEIGTDVYRSQRNTIGKVRFDGHALGNADHYCFLVLGRKTRGQETFRDVRGNVVRTGLPLHGFTAVRKEVAVRSD